MSAEGCHTYAVVDIISKKKNRSVPTTEISESVEDSAVYSADISASIFSTQDKAAATRASDREISPPKQQPLISQPYQSVEILKKKNPPNIKICTILIFLLVLLVGIALFIAVGIALIVAFIQIAKLNSALESTIDQQLNNLGLKLNSSAILDVLFGAEYKFASCAAILELVTFSLSGNYHIVSSNGSTVHVYCDMTRSCGNLTGGWMRVAELDMRQTGQCPRSLEMITSPQRTCRTMNSSLGHCSSDTFPVGGIKYSMVCGKIRAYQYGSLDAFGKHGPANSSRETNNISIETYYVDGISLTHGRSPRQHIWTFAAAVNEDTSMLNSKCPCINRNISNITNTIPPFVGEDYFCDTAALIGREKVFHADDPLWDGAGCGPQNTCCSFNTPPWFYKQLPQPTTDDIEMRVCRDQLRSNEDIAIEVVEIYVQ